MNRLIPFLLVFAAGALAGYMLAPRGDSSREEDPTRKAVLAQAQDPPPPSADATPEDAPKTAQLHGRTDEPSPGQPVPPPTVSRRVASDGRVAVVVRLVSPDGTPPAEGTVYWTTEPNAATRSMRRVRWRAPQSTAWIEPGDTWILATGGVHDAFKSEATHLDVSSQGSLQEVLLVLQNRPGVHGKVVLPEAFKEPNLTVRLRPYAGSRTPAKPAFEHTDLSVTPREDDGFAFAFHDLAPGGYLLGLSLGGRNDFPVVKSVWVDDSTVEQDLVLESFDPTHYMEVRVLGPDGQPLRDAQVSISFSGGHLSVGGGNVMLRRMDGVFIVDHIPEYTLEEDGRYKDGVYTVHVHTQGHGEIVRPYDPTITRSLTIRVAEMDVLAVQLTNYEGSAAVGLLQVGLRSVGETGVRNPKGVEPDGSVAFGKVQPGAYEIVLLAGRPNPSLVAVHRIDFEPGGGVAEIPTPVFHRLVIRVPRGAADPTFTLRRNFGDQQWSYGWARDGEPGELTFDYLTEGIYALEGHVGERWVKREVNIPAESVLRLD